MTALTIVWCKLCIKSYQKISTGRRKIREISCSAEDNLAWSHPTWIEILRGIIQFVVFSTHAYTFELLFLCECLCNVETVIEDITGIYGLNQCLLNDFKNAPMLPA